MILSYALDEAFWLPLQGNYFYVGIHSKRLTFPTDIYQCISRTTLSELQNPLMQVASRGFDWKVNLRNQLPIFLKCLELTNSYTIETTIVKLPVVILTF
jgi:hypothetical protein